MINNIEIENEIRTLLKGGNLEAEITGEISHENSRAINSTKEDIVISVIANINGQVQSSQVIVNIYVPDQKKGAQYIENKKRLSLLATLASAELDKRHNGSSYIVMESQVIDKVQGANEHYICNKLIYKNTNI